MIPASPSAVPLRLGLAPTARNTRSSRSTWTAVSRRVGLECLLQLGIGRLGRHAVECWHELLLALI